MADLRFAQLMRLIWIDAHLAKGLPLNRSDITAAFGTSMPQAASDMRLFRKRHPHRMEYSRGAKAYLPNGEPVYPADTRAAVLNAQALVMAELAQESLAEPEMTEAEFTAAFVAWFLSQQHRILSSPGDIEEYARETAPLYYANPEQRADGPEACAESDLDCWEG